MSDFFEQSSAIISACGLFRYELRRVWNAALPPYVSGMLNPSTADASKDDPTIRRNRTRAEALGYGSLIVWNLGAGRASKPKSWKEMKDPIGPDNDAHILRILKECRDRNGLAIVGWGVHGSFMERDKKVAEIAHVLNVKLHCLTQTKCGQPGHPLYICKDQPISLWMNVKN